MSNNKTNYIFICCSNLIAEQYFNLLQLKMTLVNVSKRSAALFQLLLAFTFAKIVPGQIYSVPIERKECLTIL